MKFNQFSHFAVYTDGGCKRNGAADAQMYASYKVYAVDSAGEAVLLKHVEREQLGAGTNNRAELLAVQHAMDCVRSYWPKLGKWAPKYNAVYLVTDSELAVGAFTGSKKIKEPSLKAILEANAKLTSAVKSGMVNVGWANRDVLVSQLGH